MRLLRQWRHQHSNHLLSHSFYLTQKAKKVQETSLGIQEGVPAKELTAVKGKEMKARKRKSMGFAERKKGGMKDRAQRERIEERAKDRQEQAAIALRNLGDPWNNMSFLDKKRFGLHYYYAAVQENPQYGFHSRALLTAAELVRVSPSTILGWVTDYEENGEMKADGRGKGSPMLSPMDDEEFCTSLREFVKVLITRKAEKNVKI